MKKDLIILCIIAVVVVIVATGVDIQSVDDFYSMYPDAVTPGCRSVFISIECRTVLSNWDDLDEGLKSEKYIPKDGVILAKTEYVLRPGDTAFSVLDRAVRHKRLQASYSSSFQNTTTYVQGINHLFEFSCGPLSGWRYSVNGEYPGYGCNKYELKDKDVIEWAYTCDMGRDLQ